MGTRTGVETPQFAAFVRRILRAYGRRVADADEVDIAEMLRLQEEFDLVVRTAILHQKEQLGWSWAQIGEVAGLGRTGAYERWGNPKRWAQTSTSSESSAA